MSEHLVNGLVHSIGVIIENHVGDRIEIEEYPVEEIEISAGFEHFPEFPECQIVLVRGDYDNILLVVEFPCGEIFMDEEVGAVSFSRSGGLIDQLKSGCVLFSDLTYQSVHGTLSFQTYINIYL
ncbi:hypothetical protein SDC9_105263 [bioreactor metagenome]|uniref:Uncharacterized protein n=1 Tax=bioreactor metagenome TaxID=1076179 RepID=A0A645AZ21_9ZZZZ